VVALEDLLREGDHLLHWDVEAVADPLEEVVYYVEVHH